MPLDLSSYGEPVEDTKPSKGKTVDLSSYGEPLEEPEQEKDNSFNFKSAGKAAAESTLPSMGGLAVGGMGAELGFSAGMMVGGPVGAVIGGVAGGLGGAWAGAGAVNDVQNYLLDQIPEEVKARFGFDKKTREKEREKDPMSTFVGDLAPNALALRPGAASKVERLLGAGTMVGIEAAQEKAQGEDLNLGKLATAGVFGAVSNKPTGLGKKLGLKDHSPAKKTKDPYDDLSDLEKEKENKNKPTQGPQKEMDFGKDKNSKFSEENQGKLDFNPEEPNVFRKNNQRSLDFEQEPTGKEGDLFHPENVDRTQKSNLEGVTDRNQGDVERPRAEPITDIGKVVEAAKKTAQEAAQEEEKKDSGLPMPKNDKAALLTRDPKGEWMPAPKEIATSYVQTHDWVNDVTQAPPTVTKSEHLADLHEDPPEPPPPPPERKPQEEKAAEPEKHPDETKTEEENKEKEKTPNLPKSKVQSLFEEEPEEGDHPDTLSEGGHSDTYDHVGKDDPDGHDPNTKQSRETLFHTPYLQFHGKSGAEVLSYMRTRVGPIKRFIIDRILPFVKDAKFDVTDLRNIQGSVFEKRNAIGKFIPSTNSVHVLHDSNSRGMASLLGLNDTIILHEFVHAATVHILKEGKKAINSHRSVGKVTRRMEAIFEHAKKLAEGNEELLNKMGKADFFHWQKNIEEFVAYLGSDEDFTNFLKSQKGIGGAENAWTQLLKNLGEVLGFKKNDNLYSESIHELDNLLNAHPFPNKPAGTFNGTWWNSPNKEQTPKDWVTEKLREGPSKEEFTKALVDKYGEKAAKYANRLYTERQVSMSEMGIQAVKDVGKALRATKTVTNIAGMDMMNRIKEMEKAGGDPKAMSRIQDHIDDPDKLSKADRELYDKYVKPMIDEETEVYNRIKNIDPNDPIANAFHAARMSAQKGWWARALEGLSSNPGTGGLMSKPSALKGRTMFQVRGADGQVHIIHQGSDGTITLWNNKAASTFGVQKEGLKVGDKINGWVVEDVKNQRDIEKHTDVKYVDNPAFVNGTKVVELKRYEAQLQALEEIMKSDVWQNNTSPSDNPLPGHVFLRNGDRVPMLKKFAFSKDLAYELDDFLKPGPQPGSLSHTIMSFNNMATKLFMMLPFVHMDNESVHWITSQGLSGMVNKDKAPNVIKGFQDVSQISPFYREVAKAGGSLMYPRTKYDHMATEYLNKITANAMKDPKVIDQLKKIGLVPFDFMDKVSQLSQNAMWSYRDALYMSIIRDHMSKGKKLQDAIKETDKYMPPYAIPTKVFGNRALSEAMQNPMISQFSAFHHGSLSSIGNTLVNLATKGKQMEGLDHLAAYTFMLAAVYPLIDKMYQWSTGNPNEQIRRAGPFAYMQGSVDVFKGKTTPESYAQTMFTPAMVPYALYQTATNVDTFRKKEISNSQDPISLQIMDRLQFLGEKTVNPASVMQSGNKTWTEWALKQLADAQEDKTDENEAKRNRAIRKEKALARKKMKDRPEWQRELAE